MFGMIEEKKKKKLSDPLFLFCTSGLQAFFLFVGMSALQDETRCETLEIIANVFSVCFLS